MNEQDVEEMAVAMERINQAIKKQAKKSLSAKELSNIDKEFLPLNLEEKMVVLLYRLKIDFRATPQQCLGKYVGKISRDGEETLETSRLDLIHELRCCCEFLRTIGVDLFESKVHTFGPYEFLHIDEETILVYRAEE